MSAIKLKDVTKRFHDIETIHSVNLEIHDGEFVVFVGPSGCGKSTLLRLIAGLEEITSGQLQIDDQVMNDISPADRGGAMVFQSYALYPHMSVKDNMSFGLRMAGADSDYIEQRVRDAAEILHLDQLLERKPRALSGGQRQRVAIGRAIVRKPKFFLFDEPLSNLDAELRVDMRVQIAKLHNQLKSTMIYVTHDQTEAMTLADRIVVLRNGSIEQVGTPMSLYHNPTNKFVASFIGSPKMNFLKGQVKGINGNQLTIDIGGYAIEFTMAPQQIGASEQITLGIRPEHLVLFNEDCEIGLDVTIDIVEHLGSTTFLYANFISNNLTIEVSGKNAYRAGDSLRVGTKRSDCYLFNANGEPLKQHLAPTP